MAIKNRFAIVRLWPDQAVAEHECIARIETAARRLQLEVVEVDKYGYLLPESSRQVTGDDVDFVIHLHYETPKCYDAFSYGALWNPLDFYFDWGFDIFGRNQLTHDCFLSSGAELLSTFVRIGRPGEFIGVDFPTLNHSLCEPVIPPTNRSDRIAAYVGINWEAVTKQPARHQAILRNLEKHGLLKIYGPTEIRGVEPWKNWQAYCGPLPFDGVSVVKAIAECGICLVLSSDQHLRSGVMSNRLFEAAAAGAVIIADNNAFVREHFGDSCLYLQDGTENERSEQVVAYVLWINSNPDTAAAMAKAAQRIFLERFSLETQLRNLYSYHRKVLSTAVNARTQIPLDCSLCFCLVVPDKSVETIHTFIRSLENQTLDRIELLVSVSQANRALVEDILKKEKFGAVDFVCRADDVDPLAKFGKLATDLAKRSKSSHVCFSLGTERLFSTYAAQVLATTQRSKSALVVHAGYIVEEVGAGAERLMNFEHPAFSGVHPFALAALTVQREAYLKHLMMFEMLDLESFMAFLLGGSFEKTICIAPQLIASNSLWQMIADDRIEQRGVWSSKNLRRLLEEYIALRVSVGELSPEARLPAGPTDELLELRRKSYSRSWLVKRLFRVMTMKLTSRR